MNKPEFIGHWRKGANATEEELDQSTAVATTFFNTLENAFKDGRKYVAGDQITAADF